MLCPEPKKKVQIAIAYSDKSHVISVALCWTQTSKHYGKEAQDAGVVNIVSQLMVDFVLNLIKCTSTQNMLFTCRQSLKAMIL